MTKCQQDIAYSDISLKCVKGENKAYYKKECKIQTLLKGEQSS